MGIEPLEPGFKRFRVRPQTGGLEEAKLKLPTPKGAIVLELKGKDRVAEALGISPAQANALMQVAHDTLAASK